MTLRPFILTESASTPLVVSSPHSGRIYPADIDFACPLATVRQEEDAYVDDFALRAAAHGAAVVTAEFPRIVIDLNRAETDLDPRAFDGVLPVAADPEPAAVQGFGLVRRVCRNGVPLYRKPLPAAEVARRLDRFYRPYHACLRDLVSARLHNFGQCLLIDLHSMPDFVDNGVPRPDFVLGTLDGASCGRRVTETAAACLRASGYSVAIDAPYKGREILRRYGRGGLGAQALQVEINRRLYLDETRCEKTPGFAGLAVGLDQFFAALSALAASPQASTRDDERLAAE